ncbi:hypothetical protein LINPERHAP1_LOCUS26629 [Linum perenne]
MKMLSKTSLRCCLLVRTEVMILGFGDVSTMGSFLFAQLTTLSSNLLTHSLKRPGILSGSGQVQAWTWLGIRVPRIGSCLIQTVQLCLLLAMRRPEGFFERTWGVALGPFQPIWVGALSPVPNSVELLVA